MFKDMLEVLRIGLTPPEEPDDFTDEAKMNAFRRRIYAWRHNVSRMVLLTAFVLSTCVILSLGIIPGFDGFARAGDVTTIRIEQLEARIFDTKRDQCKAIKEGGSALAYTKRLNELTRDYYNLTKTLYPVPNCSEL